MLDPASASKRALPVLLTAGALVVAGILVWRLAQLLLLIFASVLMAVLLRAGARFLSRWTPLGRPAAVVATLLLALSFLAGFAFLLGRRIYAEVGTLTLRLPELLQRADQWLGADGIEQWVYERAASALQKIPIMAEVAGYGALALGALANFLLVAVAGTYMALAPDLYRDGLVKLFPRRLESRVRETLDALEDGLRLWLLGKILAMLLVGAISALGLLLLGVPSALGLGFIAGLLEFIPYIGPFLGAAPAVVVALAESPGLALWVAGLFLLIQQAEGFLITPLIQQRTVDLPPALTIIAIIGFGSLLGFGGVLLGAPLAVLFFVLVKKLWIRDALDEETTLPGEDG